MDDEVITLSSSEDEEFVKKDPLPPRKKNSRDDVQVIRLSDSRVVLPKLFSKPNKNATVKLEASNTPSINQVNGNGLKRKPPPDDDDCILVSDSDDENQNQKTSVLSECPTTMEVKLNGNIVYDLVPTTREEESSVSLANTWVSTEASVATGAPMSTGVSVATEVPGSSVAALIEASTSAPPEAVAGSSTQSNGIEVYQNGRKICRDPTLFRDNEVCSDDFQSNAATEIRNFLEMAEPSHGKNSTNIMRTIHFKKLEEKFWKRYGKLKKEPIEIHNKLAKIIKKVNEEQNMTADNFWGVVKELLEKFNVQFLRSIEENAEDETEGNEEDAIDAANRIKAEKKQKKIVHLEKKMNIISKHIRALEKSDFDLDNSDDDHNSPYMQGERLKKQYMEAYYVLCEITESSKLTGRPVQRMLDILKTTKFPEFEKVVQDYINSKGYLFVPDFADISKLVIKQNTDASINFDAETLHEISKHLLEVVMLKIKSRRAKDLRLAYTQLDDNPVIEDPSDKDPELLRKLEENRTICKTEEEVMASFVEVQKKENPVTELVTEENIDGSPPPSENEEDSEADDGEDLEAPSDTESNFSTALTEVLSDFDEDNEKRLEIPVENEPLFEDEDDENDTADEREENVVADGEIIGDDNDNDGASTSSEPADVLDELSEPTVLDPVNPVPLPNTTDMVFDFVPTEKVTLAVENNGMDEEESSSKRMKLDALASPEEDQK